MKERILLSLVILLSPAFAPASMIASVTIQNDICTETRTESDVFSVLASVRCTGFAEAAGTFDGTVFHLSASGRDATLGGQGVEGRIRIQYPLLIVGTDQPGFLAYHGSFHRNVFFARPPRLQTTLVEIDGQEFPGHGAPMDHSNDFYLPFTPGQPFLLSASAEGQAGGGQFIGEFEVELQLEILGVVSQIPAAGVPWHLHRIPDASVVIVPEPGGSLFLTALLSAILLASPVARRHHPEARG